VERTDDLMSSRNRGRPEQQLEGSGLFQQLLNRVSCDRVRS